MPYEVDGPGEVNEVDAGPENGLDHGTDVPNLEPPGVSGCDSEGGLEPEDPADRGFGWLIDPVTGWEDDERDDRDVFGEAELPIRKLVAQSLQETISETREWIVETGLEIMAHCICPPAGHLVTLVFEAKEVFDDIVALPSQDGPDELKIPLLHLAPGIEVEAGLQLGDESETDSPRLSVFVVPGDGGLLGGLALERDTDQEAAGQEKTKTEQDTPDGAAVLLVDLSQAFGASKDPQERAAILRETASRMQSQLWAMAEYRKTSMMVLYDEHADLVMWLARPQVAAKVSAWRLELESGTNTGLLKARLLA
jgi:hypothetical protein